MKIAVILLIVVTTFFIIRSFYKKDVLEKMVMPGLVSEYHAKIEGDCYACHSPFSKESQNDKCISCHREVGKDLIKKSGYHGCFEQVSEMKCK